MKGGNNINAKAIRVWLGKWGVGGLVVFDVSGEMVMVCLVVIKDL